jgi:RNA polymerase sigma-70 factor (ECF subfamily)
VLSVAFLDGVPASERAAWETADLEQRLAQIVQAGRDAWPDLHVTDVAFVRFVGERAAGAPASWLLDLPAADLYLACGCAAGDAAALAAFETHYVPPILGIVSGKLDPTLANEAMQRMREHLFVGERPHILDYAGRGDLDKWLTITAVRAGLRVLRESARDTALEQERIGQLVDTSLDPELAHLRDRYQTDFKQAFADAFAQLDVRERNLLRHSVLDGHGVDRIAELYAIHRSTASRWLTAARAELIKRTKAELRSRLRITPTELDSLLRALADQIDITLEGILRATRG